MILLDEPIEQTMSVNDRNSLQSYFNEISKVYKKNDDNYDIVYCKDNREKLIEMNLKTVIHIAKKYRGLGLTLEELISAGNLGLCVAYDKYDPNRNKLKDGMMEVLNTKGDKLTKKDLEDVASSIKYGGLNQKFNKAFKKTPVKKEDVLAWMEKNIQMAKFNSVAAMWIKAYIRLEITNSSRLVRKPKAEIDKSKEDESSYCKEVLSEVNDGNYHSDIQEEVNDVDLHDAYNTFKYRLAQLLDGVKNRDKIIIMKKYGIGIPRPMLPKEIAEQEGLSIARVSQIFQNVIDKMKENQKKYNISADEMYDLLNNVVE